MFLLMTMLTSQKPSASQRLSLDEGARWGDGIKGIGERPAEIATKGTGNGRGEGGRSLSKERSKKGGCAPLPRQDIFLDVSCSSLLMTECQEGRRSRGRGKEPTGEKKEEEAERVAQICRRERMRREEGVREFAHVEGSLEIEVEHLRLLQDRVHGRGSFVGEEPGGHGQSQVIGVTSDDRLRLEQESQIVPHALQNG